MFPWLFVNFTACMTSIFINQFSLTISKFIALASIMPTVASIMPMVKKFAIL